MCITNGIIGKGEDLPCPVDANGRFTDTVPEFKGRAVKEADNDICAALKASGRLVMKENYFHSYPFCWRSETPLIYKAVPSWFVAVEKVKAKLLENNSKTYWVPAFVQEKRFHNWLADAKDWAISRNRFWGTPIPLWISDDLEELVAVGSVEELYELSGVRVADLHKEFVDSITIPSRRGKGVLRRVDEVFDCWFESGSMPYAQLHYPFENKERFERGFPADFIAEGLDQTRGWFYTLMVISTCLFDRPAFKNLIVNGLVLASDGKKMSKRLKNYPDPIHVLNNYGADALRLYLINSPVVRADILKFTEDGVNDVVRGVLLPWYNAFRFFVQCVERLEGTLGRAFVPDVEVSKASTNDIDVWILANTIGLVQFVHQEMQAYRLYTVVPRLLGFIEELTNWYIRLNRDRLKGAMGDAEAVTGLNVLSEVLMTMTIIMAPYTPFFSEYLYQHLRKLSPLYKSADASVPTDAVGKSDSVHYLMLPTLDASRLNPLAEARFKTLQTATTLARIARDHKHIRSNLPLKDVIVIAAKQEDIEALNYLKGYFLTEINAWDATMSTEWERLCSLKISPNFQTLGKRVGKRMKEVQTAINSLANADILAFMASGAITICGFDFTKEDIIVKREFKGDASKYQAEVSDDGSLMVCVNFICDDEILQELRARQLGASVQRLRKSSGLVVAEKVEIFYEDTKTGSTGPNSIAEALLKHADMTVKRIKTLPLPLALKPKYASVRGSEKLNDADISKNTVELVLTNPIASVSAFQVAKLLGVSADDAKVDMAAMYLQTMDYERLLALESLTLRLDANPAIKLLRGVHYFGSAVEMVVKDYGALSALYPSLPSKITLSSE